MITIKDIEDAGYKSYPSSAKIKHADGLYQKRISDVNGVHYFIDIFVYEYAHNNTSISPEIQFYDATDNIYMNVTFFASQMDTVADIERKANEIWEKLGLGYYERD